LNENIRDYSEQKINFIQNEGQISKVFDEYSKLTGCTKIKALLETFENEI
jgi:hypothetical protein